MTWSKFFKYGIIYDAFLLLATMGSDVIAINCIYDFVLGTQWLQSNSQGSCYRAKYEYPETSWQTLHHRRIESGHSFCF